MNNVYMMVCFSCTKERKSEVRFTKQMLGRLLDVKLGRGEGEGMSDHFWVKARMELMGGWRV